MLPLSFVWVGSFVYLVGACIYIIETVRGNVKPHKVSFLIWTLTGLIAFVAAFEQGVGVIATTSLLIGVTPLPVFILSIFHKKAHWRVSPFDVLCGVLSLLALLLCFCKTIGTGNAAISLSIVADALAFVPTFRKS